MFCAVGSSVAVDVATVAVDADTEVDSVEEEVLLEVAGGNPLEFEPQAETRQSTTDKIQANRG
jgi:hypothetical protein